MCRIYKRRPTEGIIYIKEFERHHKKNKNKNKKDPRRAIIMNETAPGACQVLRELIDGGPAPPMRCAAFYFLFFFQKIYDSYVSTLSKYAADMEPRTYSISFFFKNKLYHHNVVVFFSFLYCNRCAHALLMGFSCFNSS